MLETLLGAFVGYGLGYLIFESVSLLSLARGYRITFGFVLVLLASIALAVVVKGTAA